MNNKIHWNPHNGVDDKNFIGLHWPIYQSTVSIGIDYEVEKLLTGERIEGIVGNQRLFVGKSILNYPDIQADESNFYFFDQDKIKPFPARTQHIQTNNFLSKPADGEKGGVPVTKLEEECEECGRPMVKKDGKYGYFLSCSGFPKCKNTRRIHE